VRRVLFAITDLSYLCDFVDFRLHKILHQAPHRTPLLDSVREGILFPPYLPPAHPRQSADISPLHSSLPCRNFSIRFPHHIFAPTYTEAANPSSEHYIREITDLSRYFRLFRITYHIISIFLPHFYRMLSVLLPSFYRTTPISPSPLSVFLPYLYRTVPILFPYKQSMLQYAFLSVFRIFPVLLLYGLRYPLHCFEPQRAAYSTRTPFGAFL